MTDTAIIVYDASFNDRDSIATMLFRIPVRRSEVCGSKMCNFGSVISLRLPLSQEMFVLIISAVLATIDMTEKNQTTNHVLYNIS